jgi:transposase
MNMIMPRVPEVRALTWHLDAVILLSQGVSVVELCDVLGISRATYYRHLKADEDFAHQVRRARALVSVDLLRVIQEARDWRAAAWLLERRYPDEWGSVVDKLRIRRCTCGAAKSMRRR